MQYATLKEEKFVNPESECFCHYIDSEKESKYLHDHEYYELFIVVEGDIIHRVGGTRQRLTAGHLVFIRPADVHTYECIAGEQAKLINFAVSARVIRLLFEYMSEDFPAKQLESQPLPPMKLLSRADREWVVRHFEKCYTFHWQDRKQLKIYARALLAEVFQRCFFENTDDGEDMPVWLSDLCVQMRKPENFRLGNDRMVALSGRTREHLARSVKKYMNTSVTEYINSLRINYAANMLISSKVPILDICFELGYQNVGWFYTQFKKKYGMAPNQFRKRFSPLEKQWE